MSSLPLGLNQIEIKRGLTTSSVAIFVPIYLQGVKCTFPRISSSYGIRGTDGRTAKKIFSPVSKKCSAKRPDFLQYMEGYSPDAITSGQIKSTHREEDSGKSTYFKEYHNLERSQCYADHYRKCG